MADPAGGVMRSAWLRRVTAGRPATLGLPGLIAVLCSASMVAHLSLLPPPADLWGAQDPRLVVALFAAFVAAERLVVHLQIGRQTLTCSFSEIPLIVGLAFADPFVVVATRVAAAVLVLAMRHGPNIKFTFNVAHFWLETIVAATVWKVMLGGADAFGPRGWLAALGVLVITDLYSTAAVGLAMRLSGATPGRQTVADFVAGSLMGLTNVSLAVLLVTLIHADWRTGWTLVVLGAGLVVAHRSYSALRRRHDTLEQLASFTYGIEGRVSTEVVAREVASRAASLLDADVVELVWRPRAADEPTILVSSGRDGEVTGGLPELLGPTEHEPMLLRRTTRDPRLRRALDRAGLRDALSVPLRSDDGVRGDLVVGNRIGDVTTFTVEDVRVLQAIANQATVALANTELANRLRREAADREHDALHDALTGLPNRRRFQDELGDQLVAGARLAVLLLDLDRFKEVNDTLGHHTGDRLLQEVATRLVAAVDRGTVARLGGDEFAVLLPDVDDAGAASVAHTLRQALHEPLAVGDLILRVDASVGVALAPDDGRSVDGLMQRADVAMYIAKEERSGFALYSRDRDRYSPRRLALFADLRTALDGGGLDVAYQPKVALGTGAVTGVEALVRWQHERYGAVPPDEFVPIAEHTDLMLPLTAFVLESSLAACAEWGCEGLELGVAVNLSPRVLLEPDLPRLVRCLLDAAGVPAERLTLEITEESVVTEPSRTISVLQRLRHMGVRLSIDDFGTGHSSLSYVRDLPVHQIKIDRSFVSDLDHRGDPIVDTTIDLAHRLGLEVVAEGIETTDGYRHLQRAGCDTGQGYLISRPIPAAAVGEWTRAWAPPEEGAPEQHRRRKPLSVVS